METRFVPYTELKHYFEKQELNADLENWEITGICSIGDLLFIPEESKKERLNSEKLERAFTKFQEEIVNAGQMQVAILDKDILGEVLFENSNEGEEAEFWQKAASSKINPRLSINYLALRPTRKSGSAQNIFDQMIETYKPTEE